MPPFILTPLLHNHHHLCFLDHVFSTITTTTTTITSTSYVPFSPAFSIPISIIPICMAEISPSPNLSLCLDEPRDPPASRNFNVMVIVAAMLCALICALGLHSMLQCVFQCTQRALTEPVEWVSFRRRNSGLKKKEMVALPTSTYAGQGSSPSSPSADCAICLSDFSDGEKIRVLPKCNHRFHVVCIDKWLLSNSSCPTCRQRLKSHDSLPNSLNQIVTAS